MDSGEAMSRIKNHTGVLLKAHLSENFTDKIFCALDLHSFADDRGLPRKSITYSLWWLHKTKFIEKCGEKTKPQGGSPINLYVCTKQAAPEIIPKKQEIIRSKKNDSTSKMMAAANRLENVFSFGK
jgi:hypothetical protein